VDEFSYVERFGSLIARLADRLEPDVARAMAGALKIMEDGVPCPAPHTSSGALCAGALGAAMMVRWLAGRPMTSAPGLILLNMSDILSGSGMNLAEAANRPAAAMAGR
jgi:hypothetical protein